MDFRDLEPWEEEEFRKWARKEYQAGDPISDLWHPVVRDECEKINSKAEEE